jgi:enediyne biosynthesis protein E4
MLSSDVSKSMFVLAIIGVALLLSIGCSDRSVGRHAIVADTPPIRAEVAMQLPWDTLSRLTSADSHKSQIRFVGVAPDIGFDFVYRNGAAGQQLMSEATGGGCGWLDFDRDGNSDLYCVQGGVISVNEHARSVHGQLFRNIDGRFISVTESAGIAEHHYGQGVSVGDFDADGFDDVFVANIGGNSLWRNQGDGTFRNWGFESMTPWRGWSSSSAWADVDSDGDLDLYVCNYVAFDPLAAVICHDSSGHRIQCQPNQVAPVPDQFFVNLGNGTFREAAASLGLKGDGNRALGVVIADLIGDERPEIYVANDATANFLFASNNEWTFEDVALRQGCAVDANGRAQASMGISIGDYDRNGRLDLYLTHFEGEWNTLYANQGDQGFRDVTSEVGGIDATLARVGFGTVWQDFDQDGADDLFVANGHIDDQGRSQVLAMSPQIFTISDGRLHDVSASVGSYFQQVFVGRGCAEADFDGDGDFDLAVIHQNSAAELLENRSERGHWLALDFVGRRSNRRGIGVRVTLRQSDTTLVQELYGGGSYCSSRQPRLIFGLGNNTATCNVEVRWPSSTVQELLGVQTDQLRTIIEPAESH